MRPSELLIATAAFPILGAIIVLATTLPGSRRWALATTKLSLATGCLLAAILAKLLADIPEPTSLLRIELWTWLSFSKPQLLSVVFGLEATWIKAGLVSLTGGLALIAIWNADSASTKKLSDDAIIATSLLYAAGIVFIFAPNLAQAFLGWCAVSVLAGTLIRISHQEPGIDGRKFESAASVATVGIAAGNQYRVMNMVRQIAGMTASSFHHRVWKPVTSQFPNWISEQLELLENGSLSIQLLATLLGTFAVLLTWLL